ncbi:MAG: hypothetical protein KI792_13230 [Alphaproteobacteria bacterium]|nr:hypothetical protein [Alphaproteobacteria bacterium SS10]
MLNWLRVSLVLGLLVVAIPPANAQQALSKSLVQCHVVTDVVVKAATPEQQNLDMVKFFADASKAFEEAAFKQAHREGLADVSDYVAKVKTEAQAYWQPKLHDPSASAEYGEWVEYCTALGDELKLPL